MDHPFSPPADAYRPWRATALVAAAIAAVELVILVLAGAALLHRSAGHRPPAATHRTARAAHPRPAATRAPVAKPTLTRAQTSVLVLNGNGVAGAAGAAASRVHALGYRIGGVGNAAHRSPGGSVVMYRPAYRAEALRLARDLHVTEVGPLDGLRPGDLGHALLAYVVGS